MIRNFPMSVHQTKKIFHHDFLSESQIYHQKIFQSLSHSAINLSIKQVMTSKRAINLFKDLKIQKISFLIIFCDFFLLFCEWIQFIFFSLLLICCDLHDCSWLFFSPLFDAATIFFLPHFYFYASLEPVQ